MSGQDHVVTHLRMKLMAGAAFLIFRCDVFPATGEVGATTVELECRLAPASPGTGLKAWLVELRKTSGEPVRDTRKFPGDTAHFKGLQPGIYLVCVEGDGGRKRCESVDLTPPAAGGVYRFEKQLETPPVPPQRYDAHRVGLRQLSVSREASHEMDRWRLAQLRGKTKEAYQHLERALRISPEDAEALNNMGVYYLNQHNLTASIQCLQKATESDPDSFAAWANLGASYLASGEFDRALESNKRAYALQPNEAAANSHLGMSYYFLQNYAEAKKYFEKAVKLDPAAVSAPQLFLAKIAVFQKREEEALQYVQGFLDQHPNSPLGSRLREYMKQVSEKHYAALPSADRGVAH